MIFVPLMIILLFILGFMILFLSFVLGFAIIFFGALQLFLATRDNQSFGLIVPIFTFGLSCYLFARFLLSSSDFNAVTFALSAMFIFLLPLLMFIELYACRKIKSFIVARRLNNKKTIQ